MINFFFKSNFSSTIKVFLWIIVAILLLLLILLMILWCILAAAHHHRRHRSSLSLDKKTARSGFEGGGGGVGVGPPRNRSMMLTHGLSMRSRLQTRKLSSNSKNITTKPGAVSCTTAVSGRSMPATVRTGFNHRASSNNPSNRFKSLTPRIQSSRNR